MNVQILTYPRIENTYNCIIKSGENLRWKRGRKMILLEWYQSYQAERNAIQNETPIQNSILIAKKKTQTSDFSLFSVVHVVSDT